MATPMIDVNEFDDLNVDTFYVGNKDPAFYYMWANKKPENLERRKLEGYEVVSTKDGEKSVTTLAPTDPVGERRMGDVVLMRMPRERHERLEARHRVQNERQLGVANEQTRDAIERSGFETEDTTKVEKRDGLFGG